MKATLFALFVLAGMNALPLAAQDRPVNWVHGLNADETFWANERNLLENERRIDRAASTNGDYFNQDGVLNFAARVTNRTTREGTSLAIGHSMGGLAVREAIRQQPNQYQGIILCGSPLRGARIMNSIQSGAVNQTIDNGSFQLTRGPLSQFGITGYVVGGVYVNLVVPALLEIFGFDPNANYGPQTINDLAENSGYLQSIMYVGSSTPRVHIWGNENSPVHWRLLSSTNKYKANQGWQDGEDQGWPNTANTIADVYLAASITNGVIAVASAVSLNFGLAAYYGWVAFEWKAGSDYMRRNSESDWASLIGAESGYVNNVSTYVTNVCSNEYYYGTCGQYEPVVRQACQNNCYQTVSYTYTFAVQAGSDGLVAGASQRADFTQWQVPGQDQYEAVGVNHIEMRGHTNMTTQFRNVFDRIGSPFTTPRQ